MRTDKPSWANAPLQSPQYCGSLRKSAEACGRYRVEEAIFREEPDDGIDFRKAATNAAGPT